MLFLVVFLSALLAAIGLGLLSAWSDMRGMTIPNGYSVGILLAFVFAFIACRLGGNPEPFGGLAAHLITGALVFAVTFCMTIGKMMGGGDSKLMTAYAFWMGPQNIMVFLFAMAAFGFLLGWLALFFKKAKPFKNATEGSWLARVQGGQAVIPYGVPIMTGALFAFIDGGYASLDMLAGFLQAAG
ncbi:MAG: prepilin peptidase [Micavibrio aeruginosavorus]|uniref:Prepilin peptidase n=1 Tax=Micavibrio aeruginosavorus TaxID=349221 RepID=A0A7T5R3W0_9BACT|nr:MAG: prepilin peptidase [Micavibrio aeruginosavorus]